ncbi:MFS transporter [Nonomuraea sp. NPDC050643]|uniref:MFS transporter n=1 Tax=Nonomuraea sp. NPDC050643 TaxID=3155660 RepID=UPI0033C773D3
MATLAGAGIVASVMGTLLVPLIGELPRLLHTSSANASWVGISTMRDVVPPERMGASVALMSSSLGIGGALGLPVAAAIAENADWHVLFWASAGIAALVGIAVAVFLPHVPPATRGRFDVPGAIGLAAGLVCLLLAVSKGGDWGWGSAPTLGLFAAALVILPAWGWYELRTRDPLVDLRTTARRQVLLTNLASVVVGFSMYAQALAAPQLLQLPEALGYGLGQSMLAAGLWMAPAGLVMMAVSPIGARVSGRRGPRTSLLIGTLIIAAGYALAPALMGTAAGILVFGCVISVGVAFAYGAMPALIMGAVPRSETASANGFNSLMRSIGITVSSAVIGVVLAHMTQNADGHPIPTEAGFQVVFVLGGVVALAAAGVTLAIPRRTTSIPPLTATKAATKAVVETEPTRSAS